MKKKLFYILVICITLIAATLAYFFLLPEQIPIQYTANGLRYVNKAYIFALAALVIVIILRLDFKRKKNRDSNSKAIRCAHRLRRHCRFHLDSGCLLIAMLPSHTRLQR